MTEKRLKGITVGLSLSPANDLARLGYLKREFEHVMFDIALRVIREGGRLCSGGHLREDSVLLKILETVGPAYASLDNGGDPKPLLHFLAQSELQKMKFDELRDSLLDLRTLAETHVPLIQEDSLKLTVKRTVDFERDRTDVAICVQNEALGSHSLATSQAFADFVEALPKNSEPDSLTWMREVQAQAIDARIVMGGKRGDLGYEHGTDSFAGNWPGLFEETLISLNHGQDLFVLAAYGGAARDIAIDLGVLPDSERVPFLGERQAGTSEAQNQIRSASAEFSPRSPDVIESLARSDNSEEIADLIVNALAAGRSDPKS